jgi:hypothetical protein
MKFAREILGLLLIAALVMATVTGAQAEADHALASPDRASPDRRLAAPAERLAGCHAHGGTSPSVPPAQSSPPVPVSHQCCLTGHNAAVVQASFHTPPSPQWTKATLQIAPALTGSPLERLEVSMVLSTHPPGMTPLRI